MQQEDLGLDARTVELLPRGPVILQAFVRYGPS